MEPMMDYSSAELLVIAGTIILLSIILLDVFDWGRLLFAYDNALCNSNYSYFNIGGPVAWKTTYPDSTGDRQSPINIHSNDAIVFPADTLSPLRFSREYFMPPRNFRLYNDGHCVTLYGHWPDDVHPKICGGPLESSYEFFYARFRWGPNDEEGSEHTIDSHMYAMELQATYVKAGYNYCLGDCETVRQAVKDNTVVIISYFFQVVSADNPYLNPITSALKLITYPDDCITLEPAPLSCLMPDFYSKYFTYRGSLTFPPCTEGVQWMIQPEPLGISSRQVRKFRKLIAIGGPMERNTRPIQNVNRREICFYD